MYIFFMKNYVLEKNNYKIKIFILIVYIALFVNAADVYREFIKTAAMGIDAVNTIDIFPEKVFAEDNLSVKTRYGTFNGFLDKNGVKTWFGIPYAQPPVEKLRWRDPQPLKTSDKT